MKFDKYVAAGNDFIIFNGIGTGEKNYNDLAIKVCNRRFGIGADGIMLCQESLKADIKMLYYNSDGSQGEMCGNGIRSFAKYVYDYNIVKKERIRIETLDGIKDIKFDLDGGEIHNIRVHMGYPSFDPREIPLRSKKDKVIEELISIDDKDYIYSAVLVGVPHVVIFVEDINEVNINYLGRQIENHYLFPRKTNVNFVEIIDRSRINIYTWERGAGRTLGCGTGSCSSVLIGRLLGRLDSSVQVNTEGGELNVEISDDLKIDMIGKAVHIACGEFYLDKKD